VGATHVIVCPDRTCVSSLLAVPLKLGESIVTSFPVACPVLQCIAIPALRPTTVGYPAIDIGYW
jgi:hypothetical protein